MSLFELPVFDKTFLKKFLRRFPKDARTSVLWSGCGADSPTNLAVTPASEVTKSGGVGAAAPHIGSARADSPTNGSVRVENPRKLAVTPI